MRGARTVFPDRRPMHLRSIPFVNFKSVRGIPLRKTPHQAVAMNLCHNGSDLDRVYFFIAFHNRLCIFWLPAIAQKEPAIKENPPRGGGSGTVTHPVHFPRQSPKSPRRREILLALLENLEEIPFDRVAAREAARIRVDLERRGHLIGPLDLMIAGTALSRSATLVTNNTREFAGVKGLRLADWTR